MAIRKLTPVQRTAVLEAIEDEIGERKITNSKIAEDVGVDERTIRNLRSGSVLKYDTYRDVCESLSVDIDAIIEKSDLDIAHAPQIMGGYRLPIFHLCVGSFLTIRPEASEKRNIEVYRTVINWNKSTSSLFFSEESFEGEQGNIHIPPSSAFLYMVTMRDGYVRTVVASTMHNVDTMMMGVEVAQAKIFDNKASHMPIIRPIAYIKENLLAEKFEPKIINDKDIKYNHYATILRKSDQYITRFRA